MNSIPDPAATVENVTAVSHIVSVPRKPLSIRIIGVGGAGANAVSHMAKTDLLALRPAAVHTSARILETIQAPEKILLGADLTHGLGAGGDPNLARAAAEQDLAVLKELCQDLNLLFIVTGLGGGTGTGVAPVLARVAKEAGTLVLAVATLPFELEGPRRHRQAQQGLEELKRVADTVICLSNQKMFGVVDENTSVLESLNITNDLLAQGIRGIWQMLTCPSLIHVDFADLSAVLRDRHGESCFAAVEAQGEGRAREVIEQLLASPLLDGGQVLAEADAILVNLIGGMDMTMADVKRVMEEINRRTDNAQLIMGASVAEERVGRVGLTLVASRRSLAGAVDPAPVHAFTDAQTPPPAALPQPGSRFTPTLSSDQRQGRSRSHAPQITGETDEPLNRSGLNGSGRSGVSSSRRLQQGHLPLEIISKGRFEKSHPTIHRGEDLDVPTYVRRGIPLN